MCLNIFLQEAAKILKIKGLWESGLDPPKDESDEEESEIAPSQHEPNLGPNLDPDRPVKPVQPSNPVHPVSPTMPELKSPPSLKSMMQVSYLLNHFSSALSVILS
jgi:hypothetical protein